MTERVGVLGGGSWGTALALHLARKGYPTVIWTHTADRARDMQTHRENRRYLPGTPFPPTLSATSEMAEALSGAELVLAVTPSHTMREVMARAAPHLPPEAPIVSASKGIENESLMLMSEVLTAVLPETLHPRLTYLSGPSFAKEVAGGLPTAVTVAGRDRETAQRVQRFFFSPSFRVYTTADVVGVEVGGALKNVMAIAAGVADGLGYGHNTRAALITRGLHEIARLALKLGANPTTLAGLAGMGDLVLTCTGSLSRNRTVGLKLGEGKKLAQVLEEMEQVAEGVKTARSVHDLAQREEVELPIAEQVYRILYEDLDPQQAVIELMGRLPKDEAQH